MGLSREQRITKRAEITEGRRTCTKCGETKSLDEFYIRTQDAFYYAECIKCFCLRTKEAHRKSRAESKSWTLTSL